jgi:hypothetical protein
MVRKLTAISVLSLLVLAAAPADAAEVEKVRYPASLSDHATLTGFCDFPVTVTDTGTPPLITETWINGELVRIDITPRGVIYTTLEANGNAFTANNSGPVTIIFNSDGSLTVYQRGPSWTADQGVITGVAFFHQSFGRIVTTGVPNATTGFVDFTSVITVGLVTDVCQVLAA